MNDFNKKCKIENNEQLRRYVTATSDIKEGETILLEEPVLILPSSDEIRCANCFKLADTYCSTCQIFALCNNCEQHDAFDCGYFAAYKPNDEILKNLQQNSAISCVLKCLFLRENPVTLESYEKFMQLEAHLNERRDTEIWFEYQKKIIDPLINSGTIDYINERCSMKIDFELIQIWFGIIDVNSFEIRAPDIGSMRAIYLNASLLSHDCFANTIIAIDDHHQMKIYANRSINEGETISYCYTNILLGTVERRHLMRIEKYFDCKCVRCEDPTELGSHMSSLICSPCAANKLEEGFIIKNQDDIWKCMKCENTLKTEFVDSILERAKEEIFHAKDDIYRFELLLAKLSRILHPNHYLMMDMKQNIAAMLRSIISGVEQRPNKKVYERQVRLCQEILNVLCIIEPGISRLRAIAFYELSNTWAELSRLNFAEKDIDQAELLKILEQCDSMHLEAIRLLLYEPIETPEGKLAKIMLQELKDLQNEMNLLKQPKETVESESK